jgi:hypothetical protein
VTKPTRATKRNRHPKPAKSAEEVYAALVQSRGIVSAFDRTLARQITNLLVEGRVLEALKGLEALPPVVRAERIVNAHSDHSARERVIALVANAVAADQTELRQRAERGELLTEVEQLRLRLIEAEAAERIEKRSRLRPSRPMPLASSKAPCRRPSAASRRWKTRSSICAA